MSAARERRRRREAWPDSRWPTSTIVSGFEGDQSDWITWHMFRAHKEVTSMDLEILERPIEPESAIAKGS